MFFSFYFTDKDSDFDCVTVKARDRGCDENENIIDIEQDSVVIDIEQDSVVIDIEQDSVVIDIEQDSVVIDIEQDSVVPSKTPDMVTPTEEKKITTQSFLVLNLEALKLKEDAKAADAPPVKRTRF